MHSLGSSAVPVVANLRDVAAVRQLAHNALEIDCGYIAVLVNDAGGGTFGAMEPTSGDELRESIAVHVHAPFVLTGTLAPIVAGRAAGLIINVASIGAQLAPAGLSLFHAGTSAPATSRYSDGHVAAHRHHEAAARPRARDPARAAFCPSWRPQPTCAPKDVDAEAQ